MIAPGAEPPRVLHIVGTMRAGGAETLVRELLPRLAQRGVEVAAFSAYEARLTPQERLSLPYPLFDGHKRGRFDTRFPLRTVATIRRFAPDIVHTHTVTGKYWGRACALAAGIRHIVHTEHSPQPRLSGWERPLAQALAGRTNAVVTFSERTAAFVASREPVAHVAIIPNGIKVEAAPTPSERCRARSTLAARDGVIVVGIVANLYEQKNQRLAIAALARLSREDRERIRLDLFGAGPDEASLRDFARHVGVLESVKFWGFRPDVRSLLAGLDVLLSVATVEAAPISFLEAMAAELPILGTPHYGTLDLVVDGETGIVIADWSAARVTSALQYAVSNPDWRSRAGKAGRLRLVTKFDIETVADRHLELYARLSPKRALPVIGPISPTLAHLGAPSQAARKPYDGR